MSDAIEVSDGPDTGMIWHLGNPLAEQEAIEEQRASVCLASREIIEISGSDRLGFLHSITTQDFSRPLEPGRIVPVWILSAEGHVRHGFYLCDDGERSWCFTERGRASNCVDWLNSMKFWTKVDVVARTDLELWWTGTYADFEASIVASATLGSDDPLGVGRFVLARDVKAGQLAGQWAYEATRIEAGIPRLGFEVDDRCIPNEIGLYGTALDKGCYPGQETVARIHNLGRPPRRLVRLQFDSDLPGSGSPIVHGEKQVGILTSAQQHYESGPIGLALIKRSVPVDAVLTCGGIAAGQEVLVDPEVGEHFRMGR